MSEHVDGYWITSLFHIRYLADAERPVEAEFDHVVPPDILLDGVVRVVVPAVLDVPQPRLAPQNPRSVDEDWRVVEAAPAEKNI